MTDVKTTRDLAHLLFCALVALHLAKRDGRVIHIASEDWFLVDWLATAQRQKRFAKNMAADIRWLQDVGRHQGGLRRHVEALWAISTAGAGNDASKT
ncbi:DUF2913 family protein [Budvicia aquatica]|uniref:DUF2913 domain-containing protein n=1 Tax=Budvicia aquatica TaxID=82979 RepID=A0A2C6BYI9_9GAMM|nr:DUF2913 family protein [Budvicia aquatica]PHI29190.1 DUF2913 domain-containing protein [Budvicia aquatica]VFS47385.1 Protein of uncharacterised function (DUF2913) [Budvicia aquatica]